MYTLLVNNAGCGAYGRFTDISFEQYGQVMLVNMCSLVRLSYAFLKEAGLGDALINVSSVLSLLPYPGGSVYSGTKAFVTNFIESLWYEYKDRGVYIMALLSGATSTDFHNVALVVGQCRIRAGQSILL